MKEQSIPKYIQAKEAILSWILTGKFVTHEKLPSENEIVKQFAMSRQTIRQALGELEQEGWLYKEQGKGTFVAQQSTNHTRSSHNGMTIGLITTYISDYIFPTIVRGVEASVREEGARLILASTDNEKNKEKQSLESMLREQLTGLIIEPTKSAAGNPNFSYFLALDSLQIPYVMLNERYSEVDAPCLRMDDELGGYLAAEHLLELGHTRIAGFFKTDDFQGIKRMKGFVRAFKERGLPLKSDHILRYSTEQKDSLPLEILTELLSASLEDRPTALVCYNDELAVRLLDVIRQFELQIPTDLSMIGFDDSNLAIATEVKLTTLTHPKTKMGHDAVSMLLNMVKHGTNMKIEDKVYEPELIVRESTCSPKEETQKST